MGREDDFWDDIWELEQQGKLGDRPKLSLEDFAKFDPQRAEGGDAGDAFYIR